MKIMPMITKEELEDIKEKRDLANELMRKGRNGNYFLFENYKSWKIGYPYPIIHGYVGMLMWKSKYSVHLIIGERLSQGLHMPLWIESDCCYTAYNDLDEVIEHLINCENLNNKPNWETRIS